MQTTEYTLEECVPIVAQLAVKCTGYEHSSISYEKAQSLMEGVLYCIQEWESAEADTLRQSHIPAKEAYLAGREIVIMKVSQLQTLYNELIPDFQDFGSQPIKEFIQSIPHFLSHYDAVYAPHETPPLCEVTYYPVLKNMDAFTGIDAVLEYLKCIRLEQQFLTRFDYAYVAETLRLYSEDYGILTENYCSIVLLNLIAHMMLHKPFSNPCFTHEDSLSLHHLFQKTSGHAPAAAVENILEELVAHYFDHNRALLDYLRGSIPELSARLPHIASAFGPYS